MGRVIAVDIGASSYRIIEGIYKEGQLTMKVLARFRHSPVWENGHYHWNVFEIVQRVSAVLQEAAKKGERIISIGFDTFGTDFGVLDENGNLLDNPLAYRDDISDGMYQQFFQNEKELYQSIGGTFATTCTAHILKGMEETQYLPLKKAKYLLFMPDLMAYFFTGCRINESTIATTSRLLDITTKKWCEPLIDKLGIPLEIFHPLLEAGTVIGKLKREISLGIPNLEDTVVTAVASHDTASAVVTIPDIEQCSFISSGTWSVKGIVSNKTYVSQEACNYKMSNEGQPWGRYRLIRNITGLWLVEECVRNWKEKGVTVDIPDLVNRASMTPNFPSVIYTDAEDFAKAGNMPDKIQAYCKRTNQKVPDTPVDIMQTIVQGLACEYRRHNEELAEVTGNKIRSLYIVGGGRNNRYLNQSAADATGCTVSAGHPEATAMGNLMVQLWACGEITSIKEFPIVAGRDVEQEVYKPRKKDEWEQKYACYLRLLKNM